MCVCVCVCMCLVRIHQTSKGPDVMRTVQKRAQARQNPESLRGARHQRLEAAATTGRNSAETGGHHRTQCCRNRGGAGHRRTHCCRNRGGSQRHRTQCCRNRGSCRAPRDALDASAPHSYNETRPYSSAHVILCRLPKNSTFPIWETKVRVHPGQMRKL